MRTDFKRTPKVKKKSAAEKGNSETIAEDIAAFLKAGGKITKIQSGTKKSEVPAEE